LIKIAAIRDCMLRLIAAWSRIYFNLDGHFWLDCWKRPGCLSVGM